MLNPRPLPDNFSPLSDFEVFEKTKLIVFDLDGTLLKNHDDLPGERIKKLRGSLRAYGVKITLATGRALAGAKRIISALADDDPIIVVVYNGSLVVSVSSKKIKIISHRTINTTAIKKVISIVDSLKGNALIYKVNAESLSTGISYENIETVYFRGESEKPDFEFNEIRVEDYLIENGDFSATAILVYPSEHSSFEKLYDQLKTCNEFSATSSGNKYIEIRPLNSTKAAGLQDLLLSESSGIDSSTVLAVGDNDNDVELLEWSGVGIVVNNASVDAIQASNYISNFGAEQVAIEVLDLVRKAKRLAKGKEGNKNERKER